MSKIHFTPRDLEEYMANEVAEFCRDKQSEISNAPFDYDSHWNYIYELYFEWKKEKAVDV